MVKGNGGQREDRRVAFEIPRTLWTFYGGEQNELLFTQEDYNQDGKWKGTRYFAFDGVQVAP